MFPKFKTLTALILFKTRKAVPISSFYSLSMKQNVFPQWPQPSPTAHGGKLLLPLAQGSPERRKS